MRFAGPAKLLIDMVIIDALIGFSPQCQVIKEY